MAYVTHWHDMHDFTPMGLPPSPGWRVRSISAQPLETTEGLRRVGLTPVRSLRRIDPLPPQQMRRIAQRMAVADLAKLMQLLVEQAEQEELAEVEASER